MSEWTVRSCWVGPHERITHVVWELCRDDEPALEFASPWSAYNALAAREGRVGDVCEHPSTLHMRQYREWIDTGRTQAWQTPRSTTRA